MTVQLTKAIVVGASSGIGEALAVLGRRATELERVGATVPGKLTPYVHDVADVDAVPDLFERIVRGLGRLDTLVYAAGVSPPIAEGEYSFAKDRDYLQSHVAFAFLLDYVPDWRLAYGLEGFIQYQLFVPHAEARACMRDVLEICQREGSCSYLGVLKRHRPDAFLLSHAVDGWSLALDFPVKPGQRARLWALTGRLTERVLAAGGRFYFAKDAVLRPSDVAQAYGRDRLDRFLAVKRQLDPHNVLANDLWARALPSG